VHERRRPTLAAAVVVAIAVAALVASSPAAADPVSYLDNGVIRVGVDLGKGGTITWVSRSGPGVNLVNSWDLGREVQQSYYSGPDNFGNPAPPWTNFPWNPIGAGDTYGNPAPVLEQSNDGTTIYTKTAPLQWALNHVACECLLEQWITLDANAVRVRNRLTNNRTDRTQYHAYGQELPAVYTNGTFWRLFTYNGSAPYTNGPLTQMYNTQPNWSQWSASEHWAALVNDAGFGLGIFSDFATRFAGGFAGTPNIGGPTDAPTGYIAPGTNEILDWNIVYEYDYALVLGTLDEIRTYAVSRRPDDRPDYQFAHDRQHFSFANASDTGWPIDGALHVRVDKVDPQVIGPEQWWRASDVQSLVIRAAYHTSDTQAQLFWSVKNQGFSEERSIRFIGIPDGLYHTYTLDLATSLAYAGTITGIRLDPSNGQDPGGTVDIASITVGGPSRTPAAVKLASVTVRGRNAVIRWRGNATATSYDVGLRRIPGAWRIVRSRYTPNTYALRGKTGERYAIRVRAYDRSGNSGQWSGFRTFTLR